MCESHSRAPTPFSRRQYWQPWRRYDALGPNPVRRSRPAASRSRVSDLPSSAEDSALAPRLRTRSGPASGADAAAMTRSLPPPGDGALFGDGALGASSGPSGTVDSDGEAGPSGVTSRPASPATVAAVRERRRTALSGGGLTMAEVEADVAQLWPNVHLKPLLRRPSHALRAALVVEQFDVQRVTSRLVKAAR